MAHLGRDFGCAPREMSQLSLRSASFTFRASAFGVTRHRPLGQGLDCPNH
jgi:hypothetical protein